jgi:membrane-associated two-gene conflict system component 1 (EACC1)
VTRRNLSHGPATVERMTTVQQDTDVVVRIEPWNGTGYAKIRITPGHREQMQALLTEADVENSMGLEFSAGSAAMELISVVVGNEAAWMAFSAAVGAFFTRLTGRRVRMEISDRSISADVRAYSKKDAESLMRTVAELHDQREAEWQQALSYTSRPSSPDQLPEA